MNAFSTNTEICLWCYVTANTEQVGVPLTMTDDIEHYITRRGVDIITCKFPAGSRELWLPVVRVRRADHTHMHAPY